MKREKIFLQVIIFGYFLLAVATCLTGCTSRKKSITSFIKKVDSTGFFKKDSSVAKFIDSTNLKKNAGSVATKTDSAYEKKTEEFVIEWIVQDPVSKTLPGKGDSILKWNGRRWILVDSENGTIKRIIKKTTWEKGNKNTIVELQKGTIDSTRLVKTDTSRLKQEQSSVLKSNEQGESIVTIKKIFFQWWWLLAAVALAIIAWWKRKRIQDFFT